MSKAFSKILFIVWALAIAAWLLPSCKTYYATDNQYSLVKVKDSLITPDSAIFKLYEPYKVQLDSKMKVVIAELDVDLLKEKPESSLGNLMAKICLEKTGDFLQSKPDLCVLNYGGIRQSSLTKGPLEVEDAYRLMPFDNYLVMLKLDGATVQQLMDKAASDGGWPVEGVSFVITDGKATNIKVNGVTLDINRTYKVATIDYLANGGDKADFLRGKPQTNTGQLFRDAIIAYWKDATAKGQKITSQKDGRVINGQ